MSDKFDEEAEVLLPCIHFDGGFARCLPGVSNMCSVCVCRPAVAAALRELGNALACDACDGSGHALSGPCGCRGLGLPEMLSEVRHQLAQARAEIERLGQVIEQQRQTIDSLLAERAQWGVTQCKNIELKDEITTLCSNLADFEATLKATSNCILEMKDTNTALHGQLAEARTIIEQLLVYLYLHRQAYPSWNGNRFDDEKLAHDWLAANQERK